MRSLRGGRGAVFVAFTAMAAPVEAAASSLNFIQNSAGNHEYGLQTSLPANFGAGEFTFEIWLRPDHTKPVGPVRPEESPEQLINWSESDTEPYDHFGWWWQGNFLLDGHNNDFFEDGTFSLQFYGGGRVRWDFGDGATAGPGGHWAVQAWPATNAPTLLDGNWHQVTCVRRWSSVSSADLELWVNGTLIATETSNLRTNMWTEYWSDWSGFPSGQGGWFWGAEKQAAIGILPQYEDYKGLVDEIRFWSRAKTSQELEEDWDTAVTGSETGLIGWYTFSGGAGTSTCNDLNAGSDCISLVLTDAANWSTDDAPIGGPPGPAFVYVDFNAAPGGDGTQAFPFNTFNDGVNAAPPGAIVVIAPGTSTETSVVAKPLTLVNGNAAAGPVRIVVPTLRSLPALQASTGFITTP